MTAVYSGDEYIPTYVGEYTAPSRLAIHGPQVPWAHQLETYTEIHNHVIFEDWTPEHKNEMAIHIEHSHKNGRR